MSISIESSSPGKQLPASTARANVFVSEYYNALLRQIQVASKGAGNDPLAIGVTSTMRREGTTTIAVNLALAAAKASAGPILLVDANTDSPAVGSALRLTPREGLINVLSDGRDPFACIVETPVTNLSVLLPGQRSKSLEPAWDLGSINEMIDGFKHVFPLILFDLPLANELTCCFALASRLDGVLLVVEAERVPRQKALRAKRGLDQAKVNILGAVYNKQFRKGE